MVGVAGAAAVVVAAVKADMVNTLVAIPQRAHQFEFGAYQVQAGGVNGLLARASVPCLLDPLAGSHQEWLLPSGPEQQTGSDFDHHQADQGHGGQ